MDWPMACTMYLSLHFINHFAHVVDIEGYFEKGILVFSDWYHGLSCVMGYNRRHTYLLLKNLNNEKENPKSS